LGGVSKNYRTFHGLGGVELCATQHDFAARSEHGQGDCFILGALRFRSSHLFFSGFGTP